MHTPSLAEIASNVPGPVPAPRQTPAGKTGGGLAMDAGAWLAVIGGAAVAGIAIWGLVEAKNNRDDVKALGGKIDSLTATVAANNAANQAALRNVSNANAIANAVTQQQAQLALTTALAAQAQLHRKLQVILPRLLKLRVFLLRRRPRLSDSVPCRLKSLLLRLDLPPAPVAPQKLTICYRWKSRNGRTPRYNERAAARFREHTGLVLDQN